MQNTSASIHTVKFDADLSKSASNYYCKVNHLKNKIIVQSEDCDNKKVRFFVYNTEDLTQKNLPAVINLKNAKVFEQEGENLQFELLSNLSYNRLNSFGKELIPPTASIQQRNSYFPVIVIKSSLKFENFAHLVDLKNGRKLTDIQNVYFPTLAQQGMSLHSSIDDRKVLLRRDPHSKLPIYKLYIQTETQYEGEYLDCAIINGETGQILKRTPSILNGPQYCKSLKYEGPSGLFKLYKETFDGSNGYIFKDADQTHRSQIFSTQTRSESLENINFVIASCFLRKISLLLHQQILQLSTIPGHTYQEQIINHPFFF